MITALLLLLLSYHRRLRVILRSAKLRVEGGRVSHSWCMCVVVMAMVGWMGQGWSWCLVSMRDKARELVACQKVPEYISSAR